MLVLVIILIATNLASLGVLTWYLLRPTAQPAPDSRLSASLAAARGPATSAAGTRRVITIEIMNALELASSRGRLAGIAGSLAPGITRRVVYDQALKLVRQQLAEQRVVADVRLHVMRPDAAQPVIDVPAPSAASVEATEREAPRSEARYGSGGRQPERRDHESRGFERRDHGRRDPRDQGRRDSRDHGGRDSRDHGRRDSRDHGRRNSRDHGRRDSRSHGRREPYGSDAAPTDNLFPGEALEDSGVRNSTGNAPEDSPTPGDDGTSGPASSAPPPTVLPAPDEAAGD